MSIIAIAGRAGSGKDTVGAVIQYLTHPKKESLQTLDEIEDFLAYNKDSNVWEIKKFADKLKDIVCILIGCTREQLENQDFKNTELGEEWWCYKGRNRTLISYTENSKRNDEDLIKPTPRFLLQNIGTDLFRNQLHPSIWVNALFSEYDNIVGYMTKDHAPNWIITDLRFPNEYDAIKTRGGITIRVKRPCFECNEIYQHKMSCSKSFQSEHPSETAIDNHNLDYEIINDKGISELIEKVKQILLTEKII